VMELLNVFEERRNFFQILFENLPLTNSIYVAPYKSELSSKYNVLANFDSSFYSFIDCAPKIVIQPQNVQEIKDNDFDRLKFDLEEKLRLVKEENERKMKELKEENEKAQRELERQIKLREEEAKRQRLLEEEQKRLINEQNRKHQENLVFIQQGCPGSLRRFKHVTGEKRICPRCNKVRCTNCIGRHEVWCSSGGGRGRRGRRGGGHGRCRRRD